MAGVTRFCLKNIVPFVVGVLLVVAGGYYLISTTESRAKDAEVAAAVAAAQLETARQVAAGVAVPEDNAAFEHGQVVRKHAELIEGIRKKFPEHLKPDAFILDMEKAAAEGKKDKAKTAEYRVRYDYAKQVYTDYLKAGTAKPILSGQKNGLRFEVMAVKRSTEGGKEGLRFDVLIWGAPPKDQLQLQNIEFTNVLHFPEMETSGKRRGQPKRTAFKLNLAPAMPYVLLDKPWEWIPEWPTGVMAGYYVGVPMFDSRTDRSNIILTGQVRTVGGGIVPIQIEWKHVKIPAEWKGTAGGQWDDASIQPINDEDMKEQGVDPADIDAPAADAAKGK
jgi:hypothetical protein